MIQRSLRQVSAAAIVIAVLSLTLLVPQSAVAARTTDKQVKELIKEIGRDLDRFIQAIPRQYRNATIRSTQGETDVSAFLADLKTERNNISDRLVGNYSASAEVGTFLSHAQRVKARHEDGRGLFGAEAEWEMLEPRLAQLADIYNIDWEGDPASWKARRIGDRELEELMSKLGKETKSFGKLLGPDLKRSKQVDSAQRKGILETVDKLGQTTTDLSKGLRRGADTTVAAQQLLDGASAIEAKVSGIDLSPDTAKAWGGIRAQLRQVEMAYRF